MSKLWKTLTICHLKFFSTQRMCNIFNTITETMCIIIGGVDTPLISSTVVGYILDPKNNILCFIDFVIVIK